MTEGRYRRKRKGRTGRPMPVRRYQRVKRRGSNKARLEKLQGTKVRQGAQRGGGVDLLGCKFVEGNTQRGGQKGKERQMIVQIVDCLGRVGGPELSPNRGQNKKRGKNVMPRGKKAIEQLGEGNVCRLQRGKKRREAVEAQKIKVNFWNRWQGANRIGAGTPDKAPDGKEPEQNKKNQG